MSNLKGKKPDSKPDSDRGSAHEAIRQSQGGRTPPPPQTQRTANKGDKPTAPPPPAAHPTSSKMDKPAAPPPPPPPSSGKSGGGNIAKVTPQSPRPAGAVATGTAGMAAAAAAVTTEQLQFRINALQSQFESLQAATQLSDLYQVLGNTDGRLNQMPAELDALRTRGFVHAGRLESRINSLQGQWKIARPRVEAAIRQQNSQLSQELQRVRPAVSQMSTRSHNTIDAADTALNGLQNQVSAARNTVTSMYSGVDNEINRINAILSQLGWMMDQFDQSAEVKLRQAEGPVLAVEAEWYRDGDEGPDGVLYLTDQRLLFEQKEEVATKKFLGLFTTEKNKVQRLLLETEVKEIESAKDSEEGGFLGLGKKDMLDLVFGGNAPVSRARFYIKGQEASDWTTWIRRVQSGEVDRERASEFVAEVAEAQATAAAFPSQCPSCFAPVPPQPRGITSVQCEFCGMTIQPTAN